jgi:hypothetical protein
MLASSNPGLATGIMIAEFLVIVLLIAALIRQVGDRIAMRFMRGVDAWMDSGKRWFDTATEATADQIKTFAEENGPAIREFLEKADTAQMQSELTTRETVAELNKQEEAAASRKRWENILINAGVSAVSLIVGLILGHL